MTYGLILAGSGLLIFSRLSIDTPYLLMLPVFVIMGHGIGSTMAPMTAAVMNAVGPQRAGLGSAMTNTSREVGGLFGIALLGTSTRLKATLEPSLVAIGLSRTAGADRERGRPGAARPVRARRSCPPEQQGAVAHAFRESFAGGFRVSLLVGGIVLLVAAVVANRFIPAGARAGGPPGGPVGQVAAQEGWRRPTIRSGSRSAGMAGSVNPKILCEPSQNGLFLDWPQRQSVCRLRTS